MRNIVGVGVDRRIHRLGISCALRTICLICEHERRCVSLRIENEGELITGAGFIACGVCGVDTPDVGFVIAAIASESWTECPVGRWRIDRLCCEGR